MPDGAFPDGLSEANARTPAMRSWVAIAVIGVLMAAALAGLLGGWPSPVRTVDTPAVTLSVAMPNPMRNGVFFETRVRVAAKRDIGKLALTVTPSLWRDLTINSQVPAPAEESFADGRFRFDYGPLAAGDALEIKIDGQINPPLTRGVAGAIGVMDGEAVVAYLPLSVTVLP